MTQEQLQIQKRLTLNWLIQGAAQHAGMTFHHLVRDELNALHPKLLPLYDHYALINLLQYWQPEVVLAFGSPARFWHRASTVPSHPFYGHPLLAKYGGTLAKVSYQRGIERCKEKGIRRAPFAFSFQALLAIRHLSLLEEPRRPALMQLARRTAATVWGIPEQRLDAELAPKVTVPRDLPPPRTPAGALFRASIVGLGGVVRRNAQLTVIARATNWQLLAKELVKGTAELICLHGLNELPEALYLRVIDVTDRLDHEPWMLQSGGELWRRLLAALPGERPIAQVLMRLARLPAEELHALMAEVIEQSSSAAPRLKEV